MQYIECKPHHTAKTPCKMASELKASMDARILDMPRGPQNIGKINAFHHFNSTLFKYTLDEVVKNQEKHEEIQLINWQANQAALPEKLVLEDRAGGLLSELAHAAIARMKNENRNGTAAFFNEFLRKVVLPSKQETH